MLAEGGSEQRASDARSGRSLGARVELDSFADVPIFAVRDPVKAASEQAEGAGFMDRLRAFHAARGESLDPLPRFAGSPLDVETLWTLVSARGGHDEVTRLKLWATLARAMGASPQLTSASYSLRSGYVKALLPYEQHLRMRAIQVAPRPPPNPKPAAKPKAASSRGAKAAPAPPPSKRAAADPHLAASSPPLKRRRAPQAPRDAQAQPSKSPARARAGHAQQEEQEEEAPPKKKRRSGARPKRRPEGSPPPAEPLDPAPPCAWLPRARVPQTSADLLALAPATAGEAPRLQRRALDPDRSGWELAEEDSVAAMAAQQLAALRAAPPAAPRAPPAAAPSAAAGSAGALEAALALAGAVGGNCGVAQSYAEALGPAAAVGGETSSGTTLAQAAAAVIRGLHEELQRARRRCDQLAGEAAEARARAGVAEAAAAAAQASATEARAAFAVLVSAVAQPAGAAAGGAPPPRGPSPGGGGRGGAGAEHGAAAALLDLLKMLDAPPPAPAGGG